MVRFDSQYVTSSLYFVQRQSVQRSCIVLYEVIYFLYTLILFLLTETSLSLGFGGPLKNSQRFEQEAALFDSVLKTFVCSFEYF